MTVKVPGYSTLTGTPEAILSVMQAASFTPEISEDYIKSVQEHAQRFFGIHLDITGETYAERAESLLRALANHHMIELTE